MHPPISSPQTRTGTPAAAPARTGSAAPALRPVHRPRGARRVVGARAVRRASVTALIAGLLLAPTASLASAAELPPAVTAATLSTTTFGPWDGVRLDVEWAVPDSAQPGDTFTVDLPPELVPVSTVPFDLLGPDGAVVARAVWEGSTAVVTLTDYVDGRTGVGGTGFFEVQWNTELLGTDPVTTVVTIAGQSVTVTMTGPGTGPPSPTAAKWAYWNRPDQGTTEPGEALTWEVRLPASDAGSQGPVTVTDDLGPGQAMVCGTVQVRAVSSAPESPVTWFGEDSPERIVDLDCGPSGLTLVLDEIRADEFVTLSYAVDLTDPSLGEYTNVAEISTTTDSTVVGAEKQRATAGGDGSGVTEETPGPEPTDPEPTDPAPTDPEPTTPSAPETEPAAPATPEVPRAPGTPVPTSPGVVAPATAQPTATAAGTGSSRLASTGSSAAALAPAAAALLGAGVASVWSVRRRRGHVRHER